MTNAPARTAGTGDPGIVVSSDVAEAEWNAFVDSHPDGTGYHLWGWRRVFEEAFGHDTAYLAARQDGALVGVLPLVVFRSWFFGRFLVSLPFVNYGGVLARDERVARELVDGAARLAAAHRASHVELRHRRQLFPNLPAKRHKVAMLLALPARAETLWAGFDRKVRNQVRKAEKSGLTAKAGGPELLDDFYPIFARNMRDLGTPVYGRRFFAEVLARFSERTRVFLVCHDVTPVAAAISYAYRGTLEVPWASSLVAYRALCPNNLLYWTAIQHAIAEGCGVFDFGRSTPDEGTYHFKRQWGAEPQPLCWEYLLGSRPGLPDQSPKNPRFRVAIALWKRLPVRVATSIGPHIVRSIP